MNKTVSSILLFLIVVALVFGLDHWRQRKQTHLPGTNEQYYKIVSLSLPDTLTFSGEMVPLEMFYVREGLDRELSVNTYWHSSTLQLIKKANRWFPMIEEILARNGVPDDFKYLSLIESGLSNVRSPAGAVGYWQFLKGTAKDYGLEINKEVDERYHVEKSTQAACEYLLDSYKKFGNWTLTAAAYNAGNNGVRRFMDKQKAASYYDLLLSEETSRYVYRILAMKLIFDMPSNYGFYVSEAELYVPIPTHTVVINGAVESWADFSKQHGISYKILKYFNPWLRDADLKNRKKKEYHILIPDSPFDKTHEELILGENGLIKN